MVHETVCAVRRTSVRRLWWSDILWPWLSMMSWPCQHTQGIWNSSPYWVMRWKSVLTPIVRGGWTNTSSRTTKSKWLQVLSWDLIPFTGRGTGIMQCGIGRKEVGIPGMWMSSETLWLRLGREDKVTSSTCVRNWLRRGWSSTLCLKPGWRRITLLWQLVVVVWCQ